MATTEDYDMAMDTRRRRALAQCRRISATRSELNPAVRKKRSSMLKAVDAPIVATQ